MVENEPNGETIQHILVTRDKIDVGCSAKKLSPHGHDESNRYDIAETVVYHSRCLRRRGFAVVCSMLLRCRPKLTD